MADIRIKDLTTTASTTAADDFFAADGATNGTRKLSAFSPSFGGNATVGGTLTVNSSSASTIKGSVTIGDSGVDADRVVNIIGAGTARTYGLQLTGLDVLTRNTSTTVTTLTASGTLTLSSSATTVSGTLAISSTTASTSTSSGALVVGNGTSGGLGVGGALYVGSAGTFGGTVRVSTANGTAATFSLLQAGQQQWAVEIPASTTNLRLRAVDAGVDALTLGTNGSGTFAGAVSISSTTASTGTSSGALVVSGGVGVAKEVYVGTTLKLANTSQSVAAWGDIGAQLSVAGAVITDTSSSGTVSRAVVNSIAASALAASSTTTYTQAASLFVAGAPTANTNVTITNAYAIYTAGGRINFQGLPTSATGLQAGTLWNDGGTLKIA